MPPFTLPADYPRIKIVRSFEELISTRFDDGINALCWERELPGNFGEIVEKLGVAEDRTPLDASVLNALALSPEGCVARDILLADEKLLRDQGLQPVLDCIHGYPRDEEGGPVVTDVYSFHADSAPVDTDTYLCSYNQTSSEGLRNEEAIKRVDMPEVRAELRKLYEEQGEGDDEEGFRVFLNEYCYDLHYAPLPEAKPFSFGIGNLWRIAIDYPGCPVPPCIHRAPMIEAGQPSRLLLIS